MGNQLASQASVPHQDVALAISLLLLWSSIGASIGSAVSVAVWSNRMPGNLREFLPASVNETQIADFFADSASLSSSFSSSSEAAPRHQLTSSFCRHYASHYHQRVRLPLGHPTGRYQGLRVSPLFRPCYLGTSSQTWDFMQSWPTEKPSIPSLRALWESHAPPSSSPCFRATTISGGHKMPTTAMIRGECLQA